MTTQETDAQPTPKIPRKAFPGHLMPLKAGYSEDVGTFIDAHPGGEAEEIARVDYGWDGDAELLLGKIFAAAGTAAHKAKEMGYDPQKAVEALPELLGAAQDLVDDTYRQETPEDQPFRAPPTKGAVDDLQYALHSARDDGH